MEANDKNLTNELITEIAIAYYEREKTQEEIAQQFGISRIKVGRLLKRARKEGIVEINVKYHPVFSSGIEQELIEHFGIKRALIAMDHANELVQRQEVASLVTNYLCNILKDDMTIAVGQGRNVAAVASHIGIYPDRKCKCICGIGGTHRDGESIDADHISRHLAKQFNGSSETLYAPAYAESSEAKQLFMQNKIVKETLIRASQADIALVGIGDMNVNSYIVQLGWFTPQEIVEANIRQGVIGEIAGYGFFDINGHIVETMMSERVIAISIDNLRDIPCVIGIASEKTKSTAILGALRSGIIDVIATCASNVNTVLGLHKNSL